MVNFSVLVAESQTNLSFTLRVVCLYINLFIIIIQEYNTLHFFGPCNDAKIVKMLIVWVKVDGRN